MPPGGSVGTADSTMMKIMDIEVLRSRGLQLR
jgi:hypothetical protein